jgi:hypothetical protein
MSAERAARRERPWQILVTAIIFVVLLLLAFALWSEREDARRLPPERLEGVEEGFEGPV